jgi:hypothetical protein
MKNRPTVSLPDVSPLFTGREELRYPGAMPSTFILPVHTFRPVTKCTSMRLEHGFRGPFLGFRNGFAGALLKPLRDSRPKFVPETEPYN